MNPSRPEILGAFPIHSAANHINQTESLIDCNKILQTIHLMSSKTLSSTPDNVASRDMIIIFSVGQL